MQTTRVSPQTREQAEALFEQARNSQRQFWKDLYELEELLDSEVDGTSDLTDSSLDQLLSKSKPQPFTRKEQQP